MRSSTASLILAFCASMAVQAAPLTSEGNAALINRDVEENDVELQEATLSKKRSVGGFAYHASSNMIEARNPHLEEKKKELKADELSSDSSDSDSDSDSDFEDRPGNKGTHADAGLSNYSASSSLNADSADSFDDDYSANSFDAEDPANSFDAEDSAYSFDAEDSAYSFDAEGPANSFDAEDFANSLDAEDPANSLNAGVPPNPADAAASGGAPTDKLTVAVIPSGEDSGEPPKNAAESTVQANADVEQSPGSIDNKLAAASNDNLQADTEAANNNLKTDAKSQGDVLEKRDPSFKKKNRKYIKDIKKKFKKTKGGKKYKIKKCKTKNGRTKCK